MIHDHPGAKIITSPTGPPVIHVRGRVSLSAWQRTDNYNGIARPMGYRDQIATLGKNALVFISLGLCRDSVFSQREYQLMSLVQPHLQAAWCRIRQSTDSSRSFGSSMVLLDSRHQLVTCTLRQRQLLLRYFPQWKEKERLPEQMHSWVKASLKRLRNSVPPLPLFAFSICSAQGRLLVRCFPRAVGTDVALFLVESPNIPDFMALGRHGLTSRECEVLHWIAQGKRDGEIGVILGCSSATVGKHIENLLKKIRAENRATAVSIAYRLLRADSDLPTGAKWPG